MRGIYLRFIMFMLWVTIPAISTHAQTPLFLGEDIEFHISDTVCFVSAAYHFLNPHEQKIKTRLHYPVPVSNDMVLPHKFEVKDLKTGEDLSFLGYSEGISFLLEMAPASEKKIRVQYWQRVRKQNFKYILTTTQNWGRGLEWANYEIYMPANLKLEYCSLESDSTDVNSGKALYLFHREDFLPENDFEIRWGSKK